MTPHPQAQRPAPRETFSSEKRTKHRCVEVWRSIFCGGSLPGAQCRDVLLVIVAFELLEQTLCVVILPLSLTSSDC